MYPWAHAQGTAAPMAAGHLLLGRAWGWDGGPGVTRSHGDHPAAPHSWHPGVGSRGGSRAGCDGGG